MGRVKKSIKILHKLNYDSTADTLDDLDGLIFAAETELQRISERSSQLRQAIQAFKKKKSTGDALVQSASQTTSQQHSV